MLPPGGHLARTAVSICLLTVGSGASTLSLLPLETGNEWVFDRVLGDTRTVDVGRIAVHEQVALQAVDTDTYYWHEWYQAYCDSGEAYYKVSLTGTTHLFPMLQPDTLLVREDRLGNVVCRAYVLNTTARVVAREHPWLIMSGDWQWHLGLNGAEFSVSYARSEWLAAGSEGTQGTCADAWSTETGEICSTTPRNGLRWLTERLFRWLGPGQPRQLMTVWGENDGTTSTSDGDAAASFIPGIGPVWVYLFTNMTELQGIHLELGRATVSGVEIAPVATAAHAASWAAVKRTCHASRRAGTP